MSIASISLVFQWDGTALFLDRHFAVRPIASGDPAQTACDRRDYIGLKIYRGSDGSRINERRAGRYHRYV